MKIVKYIVIVSLFSISACSDDDDKKNNERPGNLVELQVDVNEINIAARRYPYCKHYVR